MKSTSSNSYCTQKMTRTIHKIVYSGLVNESELISKSDEQIALNGEQYFSVQLAAEPFTWAWVGIQLAEGALSWIGSQIISSILGDVKTINYQELIRKAIESLSFVFKQSLDEASIRDTLSRVNGLEINVNEYNRSPTTSRFQLNSAVTESIYIVSQLKALGVKAAGGYTIAQGIRFLLQQELYKLDRDIGRLQTIVDMKNSVYNLDIPAFYKEAKTENENHFDEIEYSPFGHGWVCWYKENVYGKFEKSYLIPLARGTDNYDSALKEYDRIKLEHFNKNYEPSLKPLMDAAYQWFRIETENVVLN